MKGEIDAEDAAAKDAQARARDDNAKAQVQREAKGLLSSDDVIGNVRDIPDGMGATKIMGSSQEGGDFVIASRDGKPVIGFHIKLIGWRNRLAFLTLEPLYEKSTVRPKDGEIFLRGRDGYAVGSITVNAGEFLNAMRVRFMKETATSLDPNTSYVSAWYGQKIGTSQKKLGGKGGFIYGICGRKGMNVDAIGLVIDAPVYAAAPAAPVDDSDKP